LLGNQRQVHNEFEKKTYLEPSKDLESHVYDNEAARESMKAS